MKLYEQYILSDKILIHKPESLHNSKVFIVGLSGSGKSTLGEYLAEKYNRKLIKLDKLKVEVAKEIYKVKTTEDLIKIDKDIDWDLVHSEIVKRIKKDNSKSIYEGVYIMKYDRSFVLSNPIIMLRTSLLVSTYRALVRNINSKWAVDWTKLAIIEDLYKNQKMFIHYVNQMRKAIIEKNNYITVDSKEDIKL